MPVWWWVLLVFASAAVALHVVPAVVAAFVVVGGRFGGGVLVTKHHLTNIPPILLSECGRQLALTNGDLVRGLAILVTIFCYGACAQAKSGAALTTSIATF